MIAFKVCPQDSTGLLILENTFHTKGGPARHMHCVRTSGATRLKANSSLS